jgi:hypothetical protein
MERDSPSISSKKMILGWQAFASSKRRRSCRSASPTHLDRQSAPLRIKNAANTGQCRNDGAIELGLTDLATVSAATRSESSSEQRLTRTRGTVEEDTARRGDVEALKDFGVEEGK